MRLNDDPEVDTARGLLMGMMARVGRDDADAIRFVRRLLDRLARGERLVGAVLSGSGVEREVEMHFGARGHFTLTGKSKLRRGQRVEVLVRVIDGSIPARREGDGERTD